MFNWFRRRSPRAPAEAPAAQPKRSAPTTTARQPDFEPTAPLPQVVGEGNTQADWSAWEDSMTALDSQFASIDPAARVQVRDSRFGTPEEEDPFATVGRKRRP